MSWAKNYIGKLLNGETIKFRPRGNSMTPRIKSGALVEVEPITHVTKLSVDDIVLCRVSGNDYLHLVSAVADDRVQISNNHGHINGWTTRNKVYGRLIKILD